MDQITNFITTPIPPVVNPMPVDLVQTIGLGFLVARPTPAHYQKPSYYSQSLLKPMSNFSQIANQLAVDWVANVKAMVSNNSILFFTAYYSRRLLQLPGTCNVTEGLVKILARQIGFAGRERIC